MAIKTIVFDFGNVLGFFDHRRTTERLAKHSLLPFEELHASLFGPRFEDGYESGQLSTSEFLQTACEICKLGCGPDVVAAAWADVFWPNESVCALPPLLKRQGYRILLASNTNELHANHFCRQFEQVFSHFDERVMSYEIGVRKPNAAFFVHCQTLAQCRPDQCLFIDDLPANIAGAQAHGWQGIVYTASTNLIDRLAKHGVRVNGHSDRMPLQVP
jgi:putative hydrolase of the HAD superfamily